MESKTALRLARAICSDIGLYNRVALERSRAGEHSWEFEQAIAEGRSLFLSRAGAANAQLFDLAVEEMFRGAGSEPVPTPAQTPALPPTDKPRRHSARTGSVPHSTSSGIGYLVAALVALLVAIVAIAYLVGA